MKKTLLKIGFVCMGMLSSVLFAERVAATTISDVRIWPSPDKTRIVFDLDSPVHYKIFRLSTPDRVVIDFFDTHYSQALRVNRKDNALFTQLRSAQRGNKDFRVVIDARQPLKTDDFLLKPGKQYGHRLVLDLYTGISSALKQPSPPVVPSLTSVRRPGVALQRDAIIIIDAGHGGEDPGALGHRRSKEKDLVLAVAKKLKQRIDRIDGMRAVLTRSGDYYLSLRERTRRARSQNRYADLFVSIHADAFKNKRAQGSSVFVLSNKGASSEAARWLAAKENAADLVGGVSLTDKDDMLATVLLDLSQTGTIEASFNAAKSILKEMGRVGKLHKKTVQRAGFVVLKSPDIPSVLVETAFISNPGEEKRLRNPQYQWHLANAIAAGINDYFYHYSPPGVHVAQYAQPVIKKHVIRRGDTLSAIAQRYRVSIDAIKRMNGLKGNSLRIGQILQLPTS